MRNLKNLRIFQNTTYEKL